MIDVLLIDDERAMRDSIRQWLELDDYVVQVFADATDALAVLEQGFDGVVISDLRMPGMDGLELLAASMAIDPDVPVIMITGHGDVGSAVTAMRGGAYDFIEKPFRPERLLSSVTRAAERRRLVLGHRGLEERLSRSVSLEQRLIGECAAMRDVRRRIVELAERDVDVLLVGETGTGKEVIARCLHELGGRAKHPFRPIDCGALVADRFERDMFGEAPGEHGEGQAGPFESAHKGTVFLDEILNLPLEQQAKLLRVLEAREVLRVGASEPSTLDVRVVSAANAELPKAISERQFRSDLYFRLNTIEITIPPLRERDDDAQTLFEHFISRAALRHDCPRPDISGEDVTAIRSHAWPGNVRELVNVAERFVLYGGERVASLLGAESDGSTTQRSQRPLTDQVQRFERSLIERALQDASGNLATAAEQLGIPRRTLNDKLQRHSIDRDRFREAAQEPVVHGDMDAL